MKKATKITCVFMDIGGVLLTNGWDHHARKGAATHFNLELSEMEDRHHLTFDTYEEGSSRWKNIWIGWSSIESDRSAGLSFGNSCSPSRSHIPK